MSPIRNALGQEVKQCVGCGYCCKKVPCSSSVRAFGSVSTKQWETHGCPALVWKKGRYWCKLVLDAKDADTAEEIKSDLAIGGGCCSSLFNQVRRDQEIAYDKWQKEHKAMRTPHRVFKYPVKHKKTSMIRMPAGSKILSVGIQPRDLDPIRSGSRVFQASIDRGVVGVEFDTVLWAEVNESCEACNVQVFMIATGAPVPHKADVFVGTVQLPAKSGQAVFHIYINSKSPVSVK